jgi:hypothetical protein
MQVPYEGDRKLVSWLCSHGGGAAAWEAPWIRHGTGGEHCADSDVLIKNQLQLLLSTVSTDSSRQIDNVQVWLKLAIEPVQKS